MTTKEENVNTNTESVETIDTSVDPTTLTAEARERMALLAEETAIRQEKDFQDSLDAQKRAMNLLKGIAERTDAEKIADYLASRSQDIFFSQEANIKFVRKVEKKAFDDNGKPILDEDDNQVTEMVPAEAPSTIRNGPAVYEMPDSKTQHAGFYHEHAAEIIRAYPDVYKPIVRKGE